MSKYPKKIDDVVYKVKICPKCGKPNVPMFRICRNCGTDLRNVVLTDKEV